MEQLSKSYDGQMALKDVDLVVAAGEVASLLGPNGAGKTGTHFHSDRPRRPAAAAIRPSGQAVESLGAGVTILDRGRVVARGEARELIGRLAVPVVEFRFRAEAPRVALDGYADIDDGDVVVEGSQVSVTTREPTAVIAAVIAQVPEGAITSLRIIEPSLESVYLTLTGRSYGDETAGGHGAGTNVGGSR